MIKTLLNTINVFLEAGFKNSKHDVSLPSKVKMLHIVAIIGVTALIPLGVLALLENNKPLGLFDFVLAILLIALVVNLRVTKNFDRTSFFGTSIGGIFFFFILTNGGVNNTASLWLYTYPLFTFSLLSSKKGLFTNIIMLIFLILFFSFQNDIFFATKYSSDYILRFVPSYIVVFLYSYLFASTREKSFKMLGDKNDRLEEIIAELEIKKENLTKLFNELEKRVEERTEELLESKKKAEISEKIKTEFLAQMSHEIRSPLNVVMNFIELIKYEVEDSLSEDMKYSFQSIDSASTRIIRTIDLILNMTDLQLGSYKVSVCKIDVVEMLNRVRSEYLQTARYKNLELILELDFDEKIITSDEYALVQVISNLVDNAIKYTSSGFVKISAREEGKNNLIIEVIDSGIGMSEDFLPTLFNSFTQEAHGYSRTYDGNGLGMALVKNYCELISTEISVTSRKGVGSKFTLVIPNL